MILAIDLGTKTGWASANPEASGTLDLKGGRFEGGGMRFLRFENWLNEVHAAHKRISHIYFEEVRRHMGTDAAHVYGGLLAMLTKWCEQQNPKVPYLGVPVQTIKKYATGKGNAGKPAMMEAYQNKWGVKPQDDNECDARWLLDYALSLQKGKKLPRARTRT